MEITGKEVKVIFLDGENHYSNKVGKLLGIEDEFLYLQTKRIELIPLRRIVRVEVLK